MQICRMTILSLLSKFVVSYHSIPGAMPRRTASYKMKSIERNVMFSPELESQTVRRNNKLGLRLFIA